MSQLDANSISKSRQGYLFAYAQMTFNQFRRYANLRVAVETHEKAREVLRQRVLSSDAPLEAADLPNGWRTFTLELELEAEELEIKILSALSTALFLEAYIYDYCARKESATFAQKYLDKLDPVSKWIIIPRLIVPPGLDQADDVFERLRKLFALRNDLVHHKTKAGSDFTKPPNFPPDFQPQDCVRLMCDMLEKLQEIDPQDEFGKFVLRHVASWVKYASKDSEFYPILWEA